MADTSTTVLRLVFKTENGKTFAMEFSNPKPTVTQEQVQSLMQLIISKNVINTRNGALVEAADGGVVTRTFTDLVP